MDPSCRFLRSPVNLAGETEDVIIVTCATEGAEAFGIRGKYSEVAALLAAASHERVTFVDLLRAYTNDVLGAITGGSEGARVTSKALQKIIREGCVKLAVEIVESGTGRIHAAVGEARITTGMAALLDRFEATSDNGVGANHGREPGSRQFKSSTVFSGVDVVFPARADLQKIVTVGDDRVADA
jgi:hypothetical protein